MIPRIFHEISLDESRYSLDKPFILDGHLWATDGRILVRRPDGDLSAEEAACYSPEGRKLPDIRKMDAYWTAARKPAVPLVKGCEPVIVCPTCLPSWGDTYPLNPVVSTYHEDCSGEGWTHNTTAIPHDGVLLSARYVALLEDHGVRQVEPIAWSKEQARLGSVAPVYFRTEQFEGLLMPLDADKKKEVA